MRCARLALALAVLAGATPIAAEPLDDAFRAAFEDGSATIVSTATDLREQVKYVPGQLLTTSFGPVGAVSSLDGDTRNGLATFLYKAGRVSDLRFQIVQQTQPYMQLDRFNSWGQAPVVMKARTVRNLPGLRAQYEAEVAAKIPDAAL